MGDADPNCTPKSSNRVRSHPCIISIVKILPPCPRTAPRRTKHSQTPSPRRAEQARTSEELHLFPLTLTSCVNIPPPLHRKAPRLFPQHDSLRVCLCPAPWAPTPNFLSTLNAQINSHCSVAVLHPLPHPFSRPRARLGDSHSLLVAGRPPTRRTRSHSRPPVSMFKRTNG